MKSWKTKSGCILYRLRGAMCNVFLLVCDDHTLLFDSSMKGERKQIMNRLKSLGISKLDALVFSHTHFDHAGNAACFRHQYTPSVIVHESEAAFLERGDTPLPAGTNRITRYLMHLQATKKIPSFAYEPCECDIKVQDRMDLQGMGFPAYLIHTPGHSQGSVSLIIDDEIALVGDTMFGQIPGVIFPFFADDPQEVIRSWGRLLDTPCQQFFPVHGRMVSRSLLEKEYRKRVEERRTWDVGRGT